MAQITPNRIVLISRGRHDEANADANCYPGMLLQMNSDGGVQGHAVQGGSPAQIMVAKEDALRGGDITQILPISNAVPFQRAAKGDLLLMLLQNGQNVAAQTALMSAGDGTLIASPSGVGGSTLYQILTDSAANAPAATTETTYSNGTYALPANALSIGDRVRIRGVVTITAVHTTDTTEIKIYLGGTNLVMDVPATNYAATNTVQFDVTATVRTIGASGTFESLGFFSAGSPTAGTGATDQYTVGSTVLDTTVAETIKITATYSTNSATNSSKLSQFAIILEKTGGLGALVLAQEAINNSGGTGTSGFNSAAFIRAQVI